MNELTHIDLFTGIGGFSLAAQWAGFRTVVMCEKDEYRRAGLNRAWPTVPIEEDIKKFNGRKWRGHTLLTAGVPCQPVSWAGQRRGKNDDRWLWTETMRVIEASKPAWTIIENPLGIESMGLEDILLDMEKIGYEVWPIEIPACAVNAPQLRKRIWILAHATGGKWQARAKINQSLLSKNRRKSNHADGSGETCLLAHPACFNRRSRAYRENWQKVNHSSCWSVSERIKCRDGKSRPVKPGICGLAHGVSKKLLAALGDSIVPQVAYEIIRSIAEIELKARGLK